MSLVSSIVNCTEDHNYPRNKQLFTFKSFLLTNVAEIQENIIMSTSFQEVYKRIVLYLFTDLFFKLRDDIETDRSLIICQIDLRYVKDHLL
jgi:hypothetical protein